MKNPGIAATLSFRDARHEVSEVLDAHLAQTASLVSVQWTGDEDDEAIELWFDGSKQLVLFDGADGAEVLPEVQDLIAQQQRFAAAERAALPGR